MQAIPRCQNNSAPRPTVSHTPKWRVPAMASVGRVVVSLEWKSENVAIEVGTRREVWRDGGEAGYKLDVHRVPSGRFTPALPWAQRSPQAAGTSGGVRNLL